MIDGERGAIDLYVQNPTGECSHADPVEVVVEIYPSGGQPPVQATLRYKALLVLHGAIGTTIRLLEERYPALLATRDE